MRYSKIICEFSNDLMREWSVGKPLTEGTAGGVLQPLLPSLLAACVPSAELTVIAKATLGKQSAPTPLLNLYRAFQKWPLVLYPMQQGSFRDMSIH